MAEVIRRPQLPKWLRADFDRLRERLGALHRVVWLSDPEHRSYRFRSLKPASDSEIRLATASGVPSTVW